MTAGNGGAPRRRWLWRLAVGSVGLAAVATLVAVGPAIWSTAKRHLPRPPTAGDILIDTPEVYTRERLVNDRFQQEAWLRGQLDRTAELIANDRFAGVEGRLARGEQITARLAGRIARGAADETDEPQAAALTGPASMELVPSPIDEFRDAQAYRDVIRAELMRTQLDDRHDIEGNTLYRLDFDATVSPGDNTTDLAVVTVVIKEAEDQDGSMYGRLYDDFHKDLQMEIAGAVASHADALMYSSDPLHGIDKVGLDEYLQRQICELTQQIGQTIDKPSDGGERPPQRSHADAPAGADVGQADRDCFELVGGAISAYISRHLMLRRQDFDFKYASSVRAQLRANQHRDGRLPSPLQALLDYQAPEAAALSAAKIQNVRQTLDDAAKYASSRCARVRPTSSGKRFPLTEGTTGAAGTGVMVDCPPDLNPNEPTLATIWMLQRLQTLVDHLKRSDGSDQSQPMGGALADAIRGLIRASVSPEAVVDRLPEMIGPYGDPLVNVICSEATSRSIWICQRGNPLNSPLCKGDELRASPICDGAASAPLLRRFEPGAMPPRRVDLERVAAEFILAKLNDELSTYKVALPLNELFPGAHTDCSLGRCTLVLKPERHVEPTPDDAAKIGSCPSQSFVPAPVHKLCNALKRNAQAFSYAVMPTEWSQALATEDVTRTSLLAALQAAAASQGTNLEAALQGLDSFEERVETRYRNPIVFGFASEPDEDDRSAAPPRETGEQGQAGMSEAGTRFGWIIRPRLAPAVEGGGRSFRQTPGFYPLSAIVSVPSWWRRFRIEVDAGWVNPNSSWFAPQGFAADLLAARSEECSARPSCQVSRPRVPGSVKEIKEKLRYEVRKEPYIDFEATAQNQFLEIGRPGEVVLEGGRLWRSTIVRMGHQQADRIIVLPDMKGIIAEFACVEPPPGVAGLSDPAASVAADPRLTDGPAPGAFDPRLYVPVHVWTSEGRTALPLHVALRPFVTRKVSQGDDASYLKPPCFLGNGTSLGQGSADRTGQPVTGGPRNAGG